MPAFFESVRNHPQDRALAASPLPDQKDVAAVAQRLLGDSNRLLAIDKERPIAAGAPKGAA